MSDIVDVEVRTGPGAVVRLPGARRPAVIGASVDAPGDHVHLSSVRQGGAVESLSRWTSPSGERVVAVRERFTPAADGLLWEVELASEGEPWTAPIVFRLEYPAGPSTRMWAPWGDPRSPEGHVTKDFGSSLVEPSDWEDPFQFVALRNAEYHLGAPRYRYDKTEIPFLPYARNLVSLPLVCLAEEESGRGYTFALSPADETLDLTLATAPGGMFAFRRYFHRFGGGRRLSFKAHVAVHEADWRASLAWAARTYRAYFAPPNPGAADLEGTGAYSSAGADFDAEKMKAMAFKVNWKASFDFPYMGMFLAPVSDGEEWPAFGGGLTSIKKMREYSRDMKRMGFEVLNYFNVTEFGTRIEYPPDPARTPSGPEWTDSNYYLFKHLPGAVLLAPEEQATRPGLPYRTWEGAIVTDCGDPAYAEFLLEQARRHVELLPDSAGICIDRMDWLRLFNFHGDDGMTWFDDRPARSLVTSWNRLMDRMAPVLHGAGKVIFCNPHLRRIDLMRHVDGFFDEFTFDGCALNTLAVLGLEKPVIGWVGHEDQLKPDPDAFLQRFLYMRVFPMVPFPGNDHSLQPSEWVDRIYLDYGPLFAALRGTKWLLAPRAVEVAERPAKANAFASRDFVVVPVVYAAGERARVTLRLDLVPGGKGEPAAEAIRPGESEWASLDVEESGDRLAIDVPVERGCAVVRVRRGEVKARASREGPAGA